MASCANISRDGGSTPFWLMSTNDFLFSCQFHQEFDGLKGPSSVHTLLLSSLVPRIESTS